MVPGCMTAVPVRWAFWKLDHRRQAFWARKGVNTPSRFHRSFPVAQRPMSERYVRATFVGMIRIGETLLSEDLFESHFACDLQACKGACCVKGDSGAPLTQAEVGQLEQAWEQVGPTLPEAGQKAVAAQGLSVVDADGDLVTPLVEGKECAYTVYDPDGTAKCGLEKAYFEGKTTWRKPISCHLYPIRIKELVDYTALNYHQWSICAAARLCGKSERVTVLDFCKDALIRRFGQDWFDQAQQAQTLWQEQAS